MPYGLTKKNLSNLQLLHDGLPKQDKLDMGLFAHNDQDAKTATKEHPCQTNTCIGGFGPSCGVKIKKHELWYGYCIRAFCGGKSNDDAETIWHFIFGSDWHDSVEQGQKRIKMVMDGKIPEDFNYTEVY